MTPLGRLLVALSGLAAITAVGTVGFVVVEDMSWIDALYMTVITISTVGFGEVKALGPAGKLFTIALILTAVGLVIYLLGTIAEILVEGRLQGFAQRTGMKKRIDQLSDHVIVCGFGRFGRVVVEELRRNDVPMVIVERDAGKEPELQRQGLPYEIGSATSDEHLEQSGVERARAIVIATGSDADNVFIALSARERNPHIRIHARGESEAALRRLRLAGADQVISAYQMGGQRVAASILRPSVVDFLEIARPRTGEPVDLEEVRVHAASSLVGHSVAWLEAQTPRLRVVALHRGDERIQLMPSEDTEIMRGDHLVVIGESESLAELAKRASDSAAPA